MGTKPCVWLLAIVAALVVLAWVAVRGRLPQAVADAPATELTTGDGATMRLIPGGRFAMGSEERANESPVHQVEVKAFYLDVHEVTHLQWRSFLDANPDWRKDHVAADLQDGGYLRHWDGNSYDPKWDDCPIFNISWHAAAAYARWAGKRLPTEAEWERAARGPDGLRFSYGNTYDVTKANTGHQSHGVVPVGSYEPNAYGIQDLTGNVMEWCADWYADNYYASSPEQNPGGPETGPSHVLRGGSWGYDADRCTTTFRFFITLPTGDRACVDRIGFRCAMTVPEPGP